MHATDRPGKRSAAFLTVATLGIAVIVFLARRAGSDVETLARAGGAALAIVWVLFLLRSPTVREWSSGLRPSLRPLLPVGTVLLAFGQVVGDSDVTYPFVSWHMFSSASRSHRYAYHEVEGFTAAGEPVRLVPGSLFPSVGNHLLFTRLQAAFQPVPGPFARKPAKQAEIERAREALSALGARYNRLHEEVPVTEIRLSRVTLRFDPSKGTYTRRGVPILSARMDVR